MNEPTVRTQISLTPSLRQAIEASRRRTGESLSAYLRKAADMRIKTEKKEKDTLMKLADQVIGSVDLKNHPEWETPEKVQKWLRDLRSEWD